SFGTRNTLSEQNDPNRGIGAARDWLYAEFQKAAAQSGGRMRVEKQTFEQAKAARVPQPTMLTNIVATLKGTQPESTNRVYGVSDPKTVRVFSEGVPSNETQPEAMTRRSVGGENDSQSRQLARFIKETTERYVPSMKVWMIYRRDRYGRGGDHQPFLERGYAAVRFTEPNENYQHQHQNVRVQNGIQYGDLPQFDDFNYIADVARMNAAAIAGLALAPARPNNVTFPSGLSNDTPIKWDGNKEPDLAGYEIVGR